MMNMRFVQPLVLHLLLPPNADDTVRKIVDEIITRTTYDSGNPRSRKLSIPLFKWVGKVPDFSASELRGARTVIYVFITDAAVGHSKDWLEQVSAISATDNVVTQVAMSNHCIAQDGCFKDANAIRVADWTGDESVVGTLLSVLHDVCRCLNGGKGSGAIPLKLFLSHRKGTIGESVAESIKKVIDENTSLSRFFDKNSIMSGQSFSKEIKKGVCSSTLIALVSDTYSSSSWCLREAVYAKSSQRPMIVVDYGQKGEYRRTAALANLPVLIPENCEMVVRHDILEILAASLIETLRFKYDDALLCAYQSSGMIRKSAAISARQPDLYDLKTLGRSREVIYPDPPMLEEERRLLRIAGIDAKTLLTAQSKTLRKDLKVGISISDPCADMLQEQGVIPSTLRNLTHSVVRTLQPLGVTLVYGGDLIPANENGFTEFIVDESNAIRASLGKRFRKVRNYLAWPISITDAKKNEWIAKHKDVVDVQLIDPPADIVDNRDFDLKRFVAPDTDWGKYIWSKSLSHMRNKLIVNTACRILAGGKIVSYKGVMPGVAEEFLLAMENGQPVYLLGGYSGVVHELVASIEKGVISDDSRLAYSWQCKSDSEYSAFCRSGYGADVEKLYDRLSNAVRSFDVLKMGKRCGLTLKEYKQLMHSPYPDECMFLIRKGLKRINNV